MKRTAQYLWLWVLLPSSVWAQQAGAPEPILRATIDPPRVIVGQMATLRVLVLGPNYLPAPPVLPDFQVRNAVTRSLGTVNQTETREGVSYAGVQYEFALYPQEPGSYALGNQDITVTYAAEPPKSVKATIAVPRLTFEAYIPDGARDLDPFIAASALTVEQTVKRSSQDLKVGDSVTRTVTIKAEGTPAMLLPPATFAKASGLAIYPGEPSLADNIDRRTNAISATRTDEATYILQAPGDYTLPDLSFAWWNVRDGKIERASADAIVLHVADNPALRASAPVEGRARGWNWHAPVFWLLDHWLLVLFALLALGAFAWLAPAATRTIRQRIAAHRSAYLASEAWSFDRLRAAAHDRDQEKTYFALLDWLKRFEPVAPLHTVESLKRSAQDPALDREIASIEADLFGLQTAGHLAGSTRQLLKRVTLARRRLQQSAVTAAAATILPHDLNPVPAQRRNPLSRPVAR